MYVCMYVCMHACMHVCMYVCTYVCIHIYIYVYIYIYMYMYREREREKERERGSEVLRFCFSGPRAVCFILVHEAAGPCRLQRHQLAPGCYLVAKSKLNNESFNPWLTALAPFLEFPGPVPAHNYFWFGKQGFENRAHQQRMQSDSTNDIAFSPLYAHMIHLVEDVLHCSG